jgi:hypothetical protein
MECYEIGRELLRGFHISLDRAAPHSCGPARGSYAIRKRFARPQIRKIAPRIFAEHAPVASNRFSSVAKIKNREIFI